MLNERHDRVRALGTAGAIEIVRYAQQMVLQGLWIVESLAATHRADEI